MGAQSTERKASPQSLHGRRVLVCGKGGAGKSSVVALLARALAARGYEVLPPDRDASNPGGLSRLLFELPTQPKPLIEFFGGREPQGPGRVYRRRFRRGRTAKPRAEKP